MKGIRLRPRLERSTNQSYRRFSMDPKIGASPVCSGRLRASHRQRPVVCAPLPYLAEVVDGGLRGNGALDVLDGHTPLAGLDDVEPYTKSERPAGRTGRQSRSIWT